MKPDFAANQMNSSAPPDLASSEIADAVERQFGVTGQYLPLVSERDQNFRLQATDGRRFVVKVTNAAEPAVVTEFQVGLLLHLQQSNTVRTPEVVRTLSGEAFGSIDTENATHKLRLVSYIGGQPLQEMPMDADLAQEFGRQLALLGQAMRGFSHAGESPVLLWDLQRVVELRELQSHIDDAQARESVRRAIDDFEKRVSERMTALPTQVIHGDANPENVLLDSTTRSFTGFIDFSDAIRAPRVFDVAIAASYLRSGADDPLAFMAPFAGAYNAVTPLQDDEVALIFDLVRARLATTITLLYWRLSARDENDPYRQKTLRLEAGAADYLAVLENLGRASFTEQIERQL